MRWLLIKQNNKHTWPNLLSILPYQLECISVSYAYNVFLSITLYLFTEPQSCLLLHSEKIYTLLM